MKYSTIIVLVLFDGDIGSFGKLIVVRFLVVCVVALTMDWYSFFSSHIFLLQHLVCKIYFIVMGQCHYLSSKSWNVDTSKVCPPSATLNLLSHHMRNWKGIGIPFARQHWTLNNSRNFLNFKKIWKKYEAEAKKKELSGSANTY